MITLTLLDRQEIALHCDLIAWIRANPDTPVRLVGGDTLVVCEPVDEVVRRIAAYRSKVLGDAGLLGVLVRGSAIAPLPPPVERDDEREGGYVPVLEVEP